MAKKTTTMHLYPEEYDAIKRVAESQNKTIPEATKTIIQGSIAIAKVIQFTILLSKAKIEGFREVEKS